MSPPPSLINDLRWLVARYEALASMSDEYHRQRREADTHCSEILKRFADHLEHKGQA